MKGGDRGAAVGRFDTDEHRVVQSNTSEHLSGFVFIKDERKGSGNAAAVDLPRLLLLLHRHRHHLLPRLHQVHQTHPAAVGVAPAAAVVVVVGVFIPS